MKKRLLFWLVLFLVNSLSLFSSDLSREQWISFRDGLPHLDDAVKNKKICITSWGTRACSGLSFKNPVADFSVLWHRAEHRPYSWGSLDAAASGDFIGYSNFPGFLFIDTFCNDTKSSEDQVRFALQKIRNRIPAHRDAVLVYSPTNDFPRDLKSPEYQKIHALYEDFAQKNGIPSLDLSAYLFAELQQGRLSLTDLSNPKIRQNYVYDLLSILMKKSILHPCTANEKFEIRAKRRSLIEPQRVSRVSYEKDNYSAGWLPWQLSPIRETPHILTGTGSNVFEFSFKGSSIGMLCLTVPESGNFLYSVDNSPWGEIKIKNTSKCEPEVFLLKTGMPREIKHSLRLKLVNPKQKILVGYFLITEYEHPVNITSLQGIDSIYAKIPPLKFKPAYKILDDLPRTRKKLTDGTPLSILLLGDSIVNGIRSSNFHLLMQKMYPKSQITLLTSVRGSTGCWYYQTPAAFHTYVGSKKFDLLVIGGISQRNDVEAIRKVVDMTRKTHPDAEIILMTDAWGFLHHLDPKNPCFDRPPTIQDSTYQGKLLKLRSEYASGVAFMDITTPWAHYLRNNNVPYHVFKADPVHANELGNQLLGRIIEAYFAPDNYDPYVQWQIRNK